MIEKYEKCPIIVVFNVILLRRLISGAQIIEVSLSN